MPLLRLKYYLLYSFNVISPTIVAQKGSECCTCFVCIEMDANRILHDAQAIFNYTKGDIQREMQSNRKATPAPALAAATTITLWVLTSVQGIWEGRM